ncbi:MAG: hypothetical protein AAGJ82_09450 [Bacteroidota bacterium]
MKLQNVLFILGLLLFGPLAAQETVNSIFSQMQQQVPLEMTLRTNLGQLLASTETEPAYQSAILSFTPQRAVRQVYGIKIRARGKFRLQACDFPPLKLNFSKSELEQRGMVPTYDKLKLVTHCLNDEDLGEEKLLREYIAYRLMEEIGPYSFRVQLVKIRYVDETGQLDGFERYGFLIENTRELMNRLKGEEIEEGAYSPVTAFDQEATQMHAMFQYLIGNSDYSVPVLRNIKLLRRSIDGRLVPVGYDFDFAGFVDAPYALPATHLGQLAIRQRIYLGTYAEDAALQRTIEHFLTKQKALLSIIDDTRALSATYRRDLREYILTFYEQMELIRDNGYQNIYRYLRQEHPTAVPDGGAAADYQVETTRW